MKTINNIYITHVLKIRSNNNNVDSKSLPEWVYMDDPQKIKDLIAQLQNCKLKKKQPFHYCYLNLQNINLIKQLIQVKQQGPYKISMEKITSMIKVKIKKVYKNSNFDKLRIKAQHNIKDQEIRDQLQKQLDQNNKIGDYNIIDINSQKSALIIYEFFLSIQDLQPKFLNQQQIKKLKLNQTKEIKRTQIQNKQEILSKIFKTSSQIFLNKYKLIKQSTLLPFQGNVIQCAQKIQQVAKWSTQQLQSFFEGIQKRINEISSAISKQKSQDTKQFIQFIYNKTKVLDSINIMKGIQETKFNQEFINNKLYGYTKGLCFAYCKLQRFVFVEYNRNIEESKFLIRTPQQIANRGVNQQQKKLIQELFNKIKQLQQINYLIAKHVQRSFSVQQFKRTLNDEFAFILYLQNRQDTHNSHAIAVFKKYDSFYISNCNHYTMMLVDQKQLKQQIGLFQNGNIYRIIDLKQSLQIQKQTKLMRQIVIILEKLRKKIK